MPDVHIRIDGRAGRITLNRPEALNALTWEMCLEIEAAITAWAADDAVALVLIEGEGRSFCAGGDITKMYEAGLAGQYEYGARFWQDEYRLNAKFARYPKPVVSFLQGFTMGGGVGVGCHGSHRIVGESSRISMPEVAIGLVPDVGGSLLLAHAPGRMGEYLGLTTTRMTGADAIWCGFADTFLPEDQWPALKAALCADGDTAAIEGNSPDAPLAAQQADIDDHFAGEALGDIVRYLRHQGHPALAKIEAHSPLAMACAVEMVHRMRGTDDITRALELEYRFTNRALEKGDFIEGIRAMIIDKDKAPRWKHGLDEIGLGHVSAMLRPLGPNRLNLEDPT